MTRALMEWETIDRDQVIEIMEGKQPSPPKDYSHNLRENAETAAENRQPESGEPLLADAKTGSQPDGTATADDAQEKAPDSNNGQS